MRRYLWLIALFTAALVLAEQAAIV